MTESEMIRLIRSVMKQELTHMMMCTVTATKDQQRGSMQRFANEGAISNLRLIHPYGFASRPLPSTPAVVAPIAGDPTHLNIIGQFDEDRPVLEPGEAVLYGPEGQVVYMNAAGDVVISDGTDSSDTRAEFNADGTINLGPNASHPVGLADVIKSRIEALESALNTLITTFNTHMHPTAAPGPPSPPTSPGSPLVPDTTELGSSKVNVVT